MEKKMINSRDYSVDYIKFFACLSVISIHFRLNFQEIFHVSEFGKLTSLFMSLIYQVFVICVPFFLITTGFLMNNKRISKKFYLNAIEFYTLYLLCSLLTFVAKEIIFGSEITITSLFSEILYFRLIPYSWYVEMYLGLYLLIPFINVLLSKTNSQEILQLIISLIILTGVPLLTNSNPYFNKVAHLPSFWTGIYPLVYYLIGGYIYKYKIVENSKKSNLVMAGCLCIISLVIGICINFFLNPFNTGGAEGGYGSILVVIQSTTLFILIKKNFKKENKFISYIATLTLPIYLMSYLVDQIVYSFFNKNFSSMKLLVIYSPIVILTVFILSTLLASGINKINKFIWKKIKRSSY